MKKQKCILLSLFFTVIVNIGLAQPTLSTATITADNAKIDVTCSVGVTNAAGTAITQSDLDLTVVGGIATISLFTVTHTAGSDSFSINISLSGTPTGEEVITIKPKNGVSIKNSSDQYMAADQSKTVTMYDKTPPTLAIGAPSPTSANSSTSVDFIITYTDATAVNLTSGKVTINRTGVTGGTVTILDETTTTPTVRVSGVSGDGSYTITVAGGSSSDGLGNLDTGAGPSASVTVDNTPPTISSITLPAGIYAIDEDLVISIVFNEIVNVNTVSGTPSIQLYFTSSAEDVYPTYTSGSGSNTLVFKYKVSEGNKDTDGDIYYYSNITFNGGTIKDNAGNNATGTFSEDYFSGVYVDAAKPVVTSVSVPANGYYIAGQTLNFTAIYDKNINVNEGGGGTNRPYIEITLNSGVVRAYYSSGTGTKNLVFQCPVVISNLDLDGISVGSAIYKNNGSLKDAAHSSINADLSLNNIGITTGVFVDAVIPVVSSKKAPAGSYGIGSTIAITIIADGDNYTAQGTPTVNGESSVFVNVGLNTYKVFYTVQPANNNLNGVTSIPASIIIKDLAGNTTTVSSIDIDGVDGKITINTKPTYHIAGSTSRCFSSPTTATVIFTFTGKKPYTLIYKKDGVDQPSENVNDDNFTITGVTKGVFELSSLKDANNLYADVIAGEKAEVVENPLPEFTFKSPTVTINKLAVPYNLTDNILTKDLGVDLFTGECVGVDGYFYPSLAGVDKDPVEKNITYKLTDSKGCFNTGNFTMKVIGDAAYFNGLSKFYCNPTTGTSQDIIVDGITGLITSESTKISGAIKGNQWDSIAPKHFQIFPSTFTDGWHRITYSYYQGPSKYTVIDSFNIVRVSATIDFNPLSSKYCSGDPQVLLVASTSYPEGGTGHFESLSAALSSSENATFAYFNPPAAAFNTDIYISYYYQTSRADGECKSATVTKKTVVYSTDPADFTLLKNNYNFNESPIALTGTPSSTQSHFDGVLIEGTATLNPSKADATNIGTAIKITYTFVDTSGCTSSKEQTTKVYKANELIKVVNPVLPLEEIKGNYCYADTTLNLSCIPTIGGAEYEGFFTSKKGAITQASLPLPGNTATYSIKDANVGDGIDTISFSYKVGPIGDQTDYEIVKRVEIDDLGSISMNILDNSRYCNNQTSVPVSGLHPNHNNGIGSFDYSGNSAAFDYVLGIISLIPANETNPGEHTIKYTYTSNVNSSCSKSDTKTIYIDSIPNVSFVINKDCKDGIGVPIKFDNTTDAQGSRITNWLWSWGDGTNSTLEEPVSHTYQIEGSRKIYLTASTNRGCTVISSSDITIGVGPEANFEWDNDCQTGTPIKFESTSKNGPFKKYKWEVNHDSITNTEIAFIALPSLDRYSVRLIATRVDDCADTITKEIVIQPYVKMSGLNGQPYTDDFELNKFNWYSKDNTYSSWEYGTPSGDIFNSAASGLKAWYTNIGLKNQKEENSQIVSPCFDFTELTKPMVKLNIWSAPEPGRDGAVLQYSTDGGQTWVKNVGEQSIGINWYDLGNISSQPAGQSYGWSSPNPQEGWKSARYTLENLKGQKNVRFRVVYATKADNNKPFNGFAFDDFWIGERQQSVLNEYFTNSSVSANAASNQFIRTLEKVNSLDIVPIHYHTGDALYNEYKEGPSSRGFYYGVNGTPYALVNGMNPTNLIETQKQIDFANSTSNESLLDPKISISADVANVGVKLTANEDLTGDNLILYCAVVKDSILVDGTCYYNVLRKFIPNPGGVLLSTGIFSKGQTLDVPLPVSGEPELVGSKLVVFVQNATTNQVYQSAKFVPTAITGIRTNSIDGLIDVYPIPATDYLIVESETTIDRLVIYDISGRVVSVINDQQTRYSLPVQGLQNGLYILKGNTKKGDFIRKFVKQ